MHLVLVVIVEEVVGPVDHIEEGEAEWEEDPGERVDLGRGVEGAACQHGGLLTLLPGDNRMV